jgi:plasmid stability protein
MCITCANVLHMSKMIQVRNVPDDVHRTLKMRAAAAGLTLSDYIKRDLEQAAARPSVEELSERIRARGPIERDEPSEVTVRRLRERGEE